MSVAFKLTAALVFSVVGVHAVSGALRYQRESARFERELQDNAEVFGRTLGALVRVAWLEGGEEQVESLLATAGATELGLSVRWREDDPGPTRVYESEDGLHVAVDVALPDGSAGTIEIVDAQVDERAYLAESVRDVVLTAGLVALFCALVAWGLGLSLIGRPVRALVAQARRVASGDLERRLDVRGRDELAQLAEEMNRMTDALREARARLEAEASARVDALEQLRHADRLRTVGTLSSGIAHELGTPLNVILGHAQLLEEHGEPEVGRAAAAIVKQCRRMTEIVQKLLTFARKGSVAASRCDAVEVARETLGMLEMLASRRGVTLALDGPSTAAIDLAPGFLQQVLTNLVVNAVHASPDAARVHVDIRGTAESVTIAVRDEGHGMDEATRARVFDPFFTTKDVGEGTGLGLSVAFGIVKDAGGALDVESTPGHGATFTVRLPAARDAVR
ncbi:MAG: HAMP domain-containing histidine kinase [Myxococcales bacterium]|nr:HAMP domain-containing histidine kinase [Myxococcales bacterium]